MRATFSDGSTGSFDVLVWEDGVHSRVRHLAFEDEVSFSHFLGYCTAAFFVNDPEMRQDLILLCTGSASEERTELAIRRTRT